jgi:hypothetical protein
MEQRQCDNGEKTFQQMVLKQLDTHNQKMNPNTDLIPFTKLTQSGSQIKT